MAVWGVPDGPRGRRRARGTAGLELVNDGGGDGRRRSGRPASRCGRHRDRRGRGHRSAPSSRAWSPATRSTPPRGCSPPRRRDRCGSTRRPGCSTSSAITYVDVGSHTLKGKAEPMPLWAVRAVVAAVGGAQRADGLEAPLVGRDRELRLVKELFHGAEEQRQPRAARRRRGAWCRQVPARLGVREVRRRSDAHEFAVAQRAVPRLRRGGRVLRPGGGGPGPAQARGARRLD